MDQGGINKLGGKVDETSANRKVSGDAAQSGRQAPGGAAGDTVELTSSAQLLERLEKSLAALPEIDNARVDEIRSAIERGDYEIDASAIADAMLRFDRSLG